ncbi:V-type proton ATPase subunit E [Methanobacterium spitsbergense]|uniref:A-type ATP synthase subunit E n=1 Tax=Methanobacterium spitsbergense TaxID=2874285 RepID=A0A8T5UM24_9EURY|nr:V-type proton ATPase subunit E [Methanobacterium spitsbergense]MBZ2164724.1 V-type proton ATPase subunit E [Methanobacterium spitsbergense]
MSSGTEKIVSSIMSDAQFKADSILEKAEKESTSILGEGEKIAIIEKEKILEDGKKQSTMRYQQIISEAKMNSRRMELEAREEIIEKSFKKAEEKLAEIASSTSEEYKVSLKNIITEAALEIGGGDLIILLKQEDVAKIKDSISSMENEVKEKTGTETKLEIGDNINTIGGAIVKTINGDIEVNNTIEARMLRFKKSLRSEVAHVLFK